MKNLVGLILAVLLIAGAPQSQNAFMLDAAAINCGLMEHAHTADCYEQIPVCGPDSGYGEIEQPIVHTHGENCFEEQEILVCEFEDGEIIGYTEARLHEHTPECHDDVITCGIIEHTHTDDCQFISIVPAAAINKGYVWPTPTVSTISQGYNSSNHPAIDIAAPNESNIIATKSGTVYAYYSGCKNYNALRVGTCSARRICSPNVNYWNGYCNDGFGNGLIIKHNDGTWAEYAHLSPDTIPSALRRTGAAVNQGELIGKSGSSGCSDGPHLHFALRTGNVSNYYSATPVNPSSWVNFEDKSSTYTIKYNTNGGTGTFADQTKTNGVDLTLRSGSPTRANYEFLGWSVSGTAMSATYQPGGKFTANATTTLYAVWKLSIPKPSPTGTVAQKMESLKKIFPHNSYFSVTGNPCGHSQSATCANCRLSNIMTCMGYPNMAGMADCYGEIAFAKYAFYYVFGIPYDVGVYNANYVPTGASKVSLSQAKAGDIFVWNNSHIAMYAGKDGSGNNIFYQSNDSTGIDAAKAANRVTYGNRYIPLSGSDAPSYIIHADDVLSISLNPSGNKTFTAATAGYGAQTAHSVTVSNTGNAATGALTAALSGTNAGSFTLSKTSIGSIAVGGSDSFTVVPKTGLAAGTYAATVTVSGTNITSQSFAVSFTVNPAASASPRLTVSNASGRPGGEVEVAVNIENNPGISDINLLFAYSSDLTLLEFKTNNTTMTLDDVSNVEYKTAMLTNSTASGYTGNIILYLKFKISPAAAQGNKSVSISSAGVSNKNGDNVVVERISGNIMVTNVMHGDVNGDGQILTNDLTILRRYFANWPGITVSPGADVNGDGQILTNDLTILRRYFANWPGIILGPAQAAPAMAIGAFIDFTNPIEAIETINPTIKVAAIQGKKGEIVDVAITIEDNPGLADAPLVFRFDDGLTLIEFITDDSMMTLDALSDVDNGTALLTNATANGFTGTTLVVLRLKISDTAQEGLKNVTVTIPMGLANKDTEIVSHTIINGGVTILAESAPAFLLGDVNRDGKVDILDVNMLYQYVRGIITLKAEELLAADANKDGKVDILDVNMLYQFVRGIIPSLQ